MRRPFLARTRQILAVLAKRGLFFFFAHLESNLRKRVSDNSLGRQPASSKYARQLRLALSELGPTFIKMGQALSARSDLLPPEYIDELSRLLDNVPPCPFENVRNVLENELGEPLDRIFESFDPQPIASASIGQVYAARLRDDGQEVVVKVIRPGVEEGIQQDLEILMDMVDWVSSNTELGKLYDLRMLAEEFSATLLSELDYFREAQNVHLFREYFADDARIYVPKVYWELCTSRVLTLERVSGIKINDVDALDCAGISRVTVAENLLHFALRQLFEFGLYHADPHAGNFFVQPDGSLAVMDFGMVGRLSNQMRRALLGIAQAIQRQDADRMVDELLASGIFTDGMRRRVLAREMGRFLDLFSAGALKELTASRLAKEVMGLALRYRLQLPSELVALVRAVAISEGTGMMLHPGLRISALAAPYVRRSWMVQQSPAEVLPRLKQAAIDGFELGIELPHRVMRLLEQLERGQIEFNLNVDRFAKLMSQMQHMTNRLALSVVLAGTIVALGMVTVVYHPQEWQRLGDWLFGLAFVSSLIFGVWLMWSILRSK